MARYSIDGQILTNIGDAIRANASAYEPEQEPVIVMSDNVLLDENGNPYATEATTSTCEKTVTIPGAINIRVRFKSLNSNRASTNTFNINDQSIYNCQVLSWSAQGYAEYLAENTDTVTIRQSYMTGEDGFYCECYKEIGIEGVKPEDMAAQISKLGAPQDIIHWTGDLMYRLNQDATKFIVDKYGDQIKTSAVTGLMNFMSGSDLERLPFELNCQLGFFTNLNGMCSDCQYLLEPPTIRSITVNNCYGMFEKCYRLREFPEGYGADWDWSFIDNITSGTLEGGMNGLFKNCYSLRKLPMELCKHGNPVTSYGKTIFYELANGCNALDEIVDLPIPHTTIFNNTSTYSQPFKDMLKNCYRLKEFTFAPSGPQQWASQTLDLSTYVGYGFSSNYYNAGITSDKAVTNSETYRALKDDPDWYAINVRYSRYNKESAERTLNSLPDCSAYQTANKKSANIIKFNSLSGADTDGKEIGALSEDTIAAAAAKGWTVTLV